MTEESYLKTKVRALYEMYHRMDRKDKKIMLLIDEEVTKLQKGDYKIIKEMGDKYLDFIINRKIKLLKKQYKSGDIDEETVEYEINELLRAKLNVVLELTPDNIDNLFRMND